MDSGLLLSAALAADPTVAKIASLLVTAAEVHNKVTGSKVDPWPDARSPLFPGHKDRLERYLGHWSDFVPASVSSDKSAGSVRELIAALSLLSPLKVASDDTGLAAAVLEEVGVVEPLNSMDTRSTYQLQRLIAELVSRHLDDAGVKLLKQKWGAIGPKDEASKDALISGALSLLSDGDDELEGILEGPGMHRHLTDMVKEALDEAFTAVQD